MTSIKAPNLLHVRREIERFSMAGEGGLIGLTAAITSGGQWPRVRLRDAGYAVDTTTCVRCGEADESIYHQIGACPKNCGHKDYDDSAYLAEQARINHGASHSLWLRGVPSRADTCPVFDQEKQPVQIYFGCFASAPRDAEGFLCVFGGRFGGVSSRTTLGVAGSE